MTDNDIIKALECCSKSGWLNDCDGCPCYDETEDIQTSECQERLMKNALDLINRQKAEVERLERNFRAAKVDAKLKKQEIERLKGDLAFREKQLHNLALEMTEVQG